MFESLRSLSSRDILNRTDLLVARERKVTLALLEHLHEIERKKLYLELGYGSMFKYVTVHLKYSEPAALRRMRAARCLGRVPRLHVLLESGDVNPTTLSMVAKYLKPENSESIIGAIRGKSRRDVERYVAGLEPRAALPPDRVRLIAVPTTAVLRPASQESTRPLDAAAPQVTVAGDGKKSASADMVSVTEAARSAPVALPADTMQFMRMARVEFTAHEALMAKLEHVRSLVSHRLPANASMEQLIDFIADYVIEREDHEKRRERREKRKANGSAGRVSNGADNPRQIAARVRDEVFVRDKQCAYVSPDGRRCESTHVLQVDHIRPVARGGGATIENLRLLCAQHNRLEAERVMGCKGVLGR